MNSIMTSQKILIYYFTFSRQCGVYSASHSFKVTKLKNGCLSLPLLDRLINNKLKKNNTDLNRKVYVFSLTRK